MVQVGDILETKKAGSFKILQALGVPGATATAFLAAPVKNDHVNNAGVQVAVKVRHPNLDAQLAARFAQEGVILRRLQDVEERQVPPTHYFPRLITADDKPERTWFAMEFVPGVSAAEIIQTEQRLSETEALNIAWRMAHALSLVHSIQIAYKDMKLSNFLWDRERREPSFPLKAIDWNVIEERDFAPAARRDLFRVGAYLFHMLTGRELALENDKPPASLEGTEGWNEISEGTRRILKKSLHPDPQRRYSWAKDLHQDLYRHYQRFAITPDELVQQARGELEKGHPLEAYLALDVAQLRAANETFPDVTTFADDLLRARALIIEQENKQSENAKGRLKQGLYDKAIDSLSQLLDQSPAAVDIWRWLVMAHLAKRNPSLFDEPPVKDTLFEFLALAEKQPQPLVQMQGLLRRAGEYWRQKSGELAPELNALMSQAEFLQVAKQADEAHTRAQFEQARDLYLRASDLLGGTTLRQDVLIASWGDPAYFAQKAEDERHAQEAEQKSREEQAKAQRLAQQRIEAGKKAFEDRRYADAAAKLQPPLDEESAQYAAAAKFLTKCVGLLNNIRGNDSDSITQQNAKELFNTIQEFISQSNEIKWSRDPCKKTVERAIEELRGFLRKNKEAPNLALCAYVVHDCGRLLSGKIEGGDLEWFEKQQKAAETGLEREIGRSIEAGTRAAYAQARSTVQVWSWNDALGLLGRAKIADIEARIQDLQVRFGQYQAAQAEKDLFRQYQIVKGALEAGHRAWTQPPGTDTETKLKDLALQILTEIRRIYSEQILPTREELIPKGEYERAFDEMMAYAEILSENPVWSKEFRPRYAELARKLTLEVNSENYQKVVTAWLHIKNQVAQSQVFQGTDFIDICEKGLRAKIKGALLEKARQALTKARYDDAEKYYADLGEAFVQLGFQDKDVENYQERVRTWKAQRVEIAQFLNGWFTDPVKAKDSIVRLLSGWSANPLKAKISIAQLLSDWSADPVKVRSSLRENSSWLPEDNLDIIRFRDRLKEWEGRIKSLENEFDKTDDLGTRVRILSKAARLGCKYWNDYGAGGYHARPIVEVIERQARRWAEQLAREADDKYLQEDFGKAAVLCERAASILDSWSTTPTNVSGLIVRRRERAEQCRKRARELAAKPQVSPVTESQANADKQKPVEEIVATNDIPGSEMPPSQPQATAATEPLGRSEGVEALPSPTSDNTPLVPEGKERETQAQEIVTFSADRETPETVAPRSMQNDADHLTELAPQSPALARVNTGGAESVSPPDGTQVPIVHSERHADKPTESHQIESHEEVKAIPDESQDSPADTHSQSMMRVQEAERELLELNLPKAQSLLKDAEELWAENPKIRDVREASAAYQALDAQMQKELGDIKRFIKLAKQDADSPGAEVRANAVKKLDSAEQLLGKLVVRKPSHSLLSRFSDEIGRLRRQIGDSKSPQSTSYR